MDIPRRIVTWLIWVGATVAVIKFDAARQRRLATERGEVDFLERGVGTYLGLALCCGPAPLVFYFTVTRKGVGGFLVGSLIAAAIMVVVGATWTLLGALLG